MLRLANALLELSPIMSATLYMVICLAGFDNIRPLWLALCFIQTRIVQSDGCNLCDVQGRSVNRTMPFSLATLMAGISK